MPANTQTGEQLIDGLSEFIEDSWDRTSTSAGAADGTSVVDTQLAAFGEDSMADGWIRVTSGAASGEIQRVTSNTGSTVLVSPGFTTQILTSISYEFHRWNPETKFEVLDAARLHGFPHLSRVVFDETITTDGRAREFDLAGDLRKGPYFAWMEDPLTPDQQWNLLKTPKGDALTDWVLAGGAATAVLVSEEPRDRLIPKYDDFATKISVPDSTAVTYTQTVGTFDITAGDAAGRRMEFAKWVYCRTSGRVALTLTDDSGTTTSPFHQGLGWELLRVERDIDGDNATTLSVALSVSSGTPLTVFWNRAWFVFGEVPDCFLHEITNVRIRRDGSVQRALLDFPLIRAPAAAARRSRAAVGAERERHGDDGGGRG